MIYFCKWATISDALIILAGMTAHDLRLFHLNPKMLFHKINSRKNGQVGIPFTAAWSARDAFPPVHHFSQCRLQFNVPSGIFIGCQQSRTDHYMVFRAMHMAEWLFHHLLYDLNRIL